MTAPAPKPNLERALAFGRPSWWPRTHAYAEMLAEAWDADLPFETWVSHLDAFDRLHRTATIHPLRLVPKP